MFYTPLNSLRLKSTLYKKTSTFGTALRAYSNFLSKFPNFKEISLN